MNNTISKSKQTQKQTTQQPTQNKNKQKQQNNIVKQIIPDSADLPPLTASLFHTGFKNTHFNQNQHQSTSQSRASSSDKAPKLSRTSSLSIGNNKKKTVEKIVWGSVSGMSRSESKQTPVGSPVNGMGKKILIKN